MANMTETELRRRLKKLESEPTASTALVSKVGDQYEYDKDFIYIAYASALANLSSGSITNQSDATNFQFSPYSDTGTLMAYRGYFINKSIYQSGDPTDYTWEATSGTAGYTSAERSYTTSSGLQNTLGNPTKPGSGVGWAPLSSGVAVPSTATYLAERFTLTTTGGAVTSNWDIEPVGKHIDQTVVSASGIKAENIDLDGTLNVTANSGAIKWGKTDGDDITNSGLFIGRNSSGSPRFVIGSTNSFIYFNGSTGTVSAVGVAESATTGTETNYYESAGTHTFSISPLLGTIQIEIAGAGGGGGGQGGDFGQAGTTGGTSYVYVKRANGTTRSTFSASGGSGGAKGGGGNPGGTGASFGNQGNIGNSSNANASHSGGAGSTHQAEPAVRPIASNGGTASGGGGNGTAGSQGGGAGGGAGSYYSTTYTIVDNTDSLQIVVGSGGIGDNAYVNTPGDNGGGGDGGAGMVRIKGVLS